MQCRFPSPPDSRLGRGAPFYRPFFPTGEVIRQLYMWEPIHVAHCALPQVWRPQFLDVACTNLLSPPSPPLWSIQYSHPAAHIGQHRPLLGYGHRTLHRLPSVMLKSSASHWSGSRLSGLVCLPYMFTGSRDVPILRCITGRPGQSLFPSLWFLPWVADFFGGTRFSNRWEPPALLVRVMLS